MSEETEPNRTHPRNGSGQARAGRDVPRAGSAGRGSWRRQFFIAATVLCALVLAAWIGVLVVTLPRNFRAGGWQATWVGFDIALLAVFVITAWAAWRRRQLLIVCLVVLSTLLTCDAWFDTTLDWGTRGFTESLVLAFVVELPLAVAALIGARRLLRVTIRRVEELEGGKGSVTPFWRVPLFGEDSVSYRDVWRPAGYQARTAGRCPPEQDARGRLPEAVRRAEN